MKSSFFTKSIAFLLSILMVMSILPLSVFAEILQDTQDMADSVADEKINSDVFELTELREESVKLFRLEDGTYIAV